MELAQVCVLERAPMPVPVVPIHARDAWDAAVVGAVAAAERGHHAVLAALSVRLVAAQDVQADAEDGVKAYVARRVQDARVHVVRLAEVPVAEGVQADAAAIAQRAVTGAPVAPVAAMSVRVVRDARDVAVPMPVA